MPNSQHGTFDLSSSSYRENCNRLRYLEEKQRELCALSQNILTVSHSQTCSRIASAHDVLLHYSLPQKILIYLNSQFVIFFTCYSFGNGILILFVRLCLTFQTPVVTLCTARFNIKKFFLQPTRCIYVLLWISDQTAITESYTPTNALLYTIKYQYKMFTLKHLKTLQHVSIIIQIIFRELVCSLLKLLILKFVKNVKRQCGDAAA